MMLTTILAIALTAQTTSNEQQRQAQLKALAAKIHQESLAKKPQAKPKPKTPTSPPPPSIQYVDVPSVEAGTRLYVWTSGLERLPICPDLFRVKGLQASVYDDDQKALDEIITHERLPYVTRGTPVRVVRTLGSGSSIPMDTATAIMEMRAANLKPTSEKDFPICEVRILEGPFKGQSGWVLEFLLRDRVEVNLKKPKRHR